MVQVIDLATATLSAIERRASSVIRNAAKAWRSHTLTTAQRKIVSEYHKRYCRGFIPPVDAVKQAQGFLTKNFVGYADLRWHELYWNITGNLDAAFIPSDIFFVTIEPTLNDMGHALVLTDKNLMYDLPLAAYLPEPVLHIVDGDVYLPSFIRFGDDRIATILGDSRDEFIIKPSIMHGGGIDLRALDGASASGFLKQILSDRHARQNANWIVQRRLEQCRETASFNASSVNTFRVLTLRIDTGIVHLSTVFRVGRKGMRADNHGAGGIACGAERGCLTGRGMDNRLHFYDEHPDSGMAFRGELPSWKAALSLCKKMHVGLPWFDLISWDVAIDPHHEPRIIEFNVANQELLFHQVTNGPVFGSEGSAPLSAVLRRRPTQSRTRAEAQKGRR